MHNIPEDDATLFLSGGERHPRHPSVTLSLSLALRRNLQLSPVEIVYKFYGEPVDDDGDYYSPS